MKHKLLIVIACVLSLAILLPACAVDTEREEIVSFTRQALEIEAKLSELMGYIVNNFNPMNYDTAVDRWFLRGVASNAPRGMYMTPYQLSLYNHHAYDATPGAQGDLEGILSLKNRLSLLDCPQSLHSVKDSLSQIYSAEIEQAQLQSELLMQGSNSHPIVYPDVTKDNLDYWRQSRPKKVELHDEGMTVYYSEPIRKWWDVRQYLNVAMLRGLEGLWYRGESLTPQVEAQLKGVHQRYSFGQPNFNMWLKQIRSLWEDYLEVMNKTGGFDVATARLESDWFAIQEFRLEVYTHWAEILREHGIDPAQEGFTELVGQG